MHKFSHNSRLMILMLFTFLTSACASTPKHINFLKIDDEIAIESQKVEIKDYKFTFSNEDLDDKATTGALTGAAGGAIVAGLACGPLWLLCASTGALLFGGAGYVVGGVVGITTNLDVYKKENVDAITANIDSFITSNNPQKDFLTSFTKIADNRYQINPAANKKIKVVFLGMGLNHHGEDNVTLVTQAVVTINYTDDSGDTEEISQLFQYVSPPNNIETWVNNDNAFYQQHFDKAYRTMSENIIMTLAY